MPISFLDVSNKILAHCHEPLKTITYKKKYIQYIENAVSALILSSIAKKKNIVTKIN